MGDNFLKRQAQNFKKGRDLAMAKLSEPALFRRPEVMHTVYTAVPAEQCRFEPGETLAVVSSADGRSACLARGHQNVGCVEGDSAQSLLSALAENGAAGIARVQITEVSGISGVAKAVVAKESKQ